MDAFNSPFYPFVLAVTDTAKEGLNFHSYCRRIIHLNIPDKAAVLIQREGRVDRYRSLVLRQRLAKINDYKINDWNDWKLLLKNSASEDSLQNNNGMIPDWYIDMDEGPKIEKYYLVNSGTDDMLKEGNIEREVDLYKRMMGSFLEEDLIKSLHRRYKDRDITVLKLNLIP